MSETHRRWECGDMNTPMRVSLDIAVRSAALLALTEGVAAIYSAKTPDDDGLGTGLTAMFALVCAAACWGMWDGFHRSPGRLCVTWLATGAVMSLGTTIYSLVRWDGWSWSVLASDLSSGFAFWTGLVFVPAIACGIVQSALRPVNTRPERTI